ncbi:hypothetical protein GUITHDRAFT_90014 [Guillardia theta CCMP2712]|uniref:Protein DETOXIFICATION n=1 Tax=Guillardia theta (strain CCMP2712) TaxID=905079 RepID=L1IJL6_GUITC|nr:hypothetical protein GUITHDRAFT_90014 [Guillardia theta CCMP2712]EKX36277.1 hypothetical protein GUITHDRAFT_90014 [Guillardia theta CCMP2712]|eukprot:XP_005823257.1 hypothetical protein GUITHDRAFT_90014 [Guillardia theta CCMP2712]
MKGGSDEGEELHSTQDMLRFAIPALGIFIAGPLLSVIDTVFISKTAVDEVRSLAALQPAAFICDMSVFLLGFLARATTGRVSRAIVRDSSGEETRAEMRRALSLALIVGLTLSCILFTFAPMLLSKMLGVDPRLIEPATEYVRYRAPGVPAAVLSYVVIAGLLCTKDSVTPLRSVLWSGAANVVGDAIFCHYMRGGLAGAALATSISQCLGACLQLMSAREKRILPDLTSILHLPRAVLSYFNPLFVYVGPLATISLTRAYGFTLMTKRVSSLSPQKIGAYQVLFQLFAFFAFFGEPLSQTAQTTLPRLLDAGDSKGAWKVMGNLGSLSLIASVLVGSVFATLATVGNGLFVTDLAIRQAMREASHVVTGCIVVLMFSASLDGAMLAGREFGWVVGTSIVTLFVLAAMLKFHGDSLAGVWLGFGSRVLIYCFACCFRLMGLAERCATRHSAQEGP